MQINREQLNELNGLQEDMASHFTDLNTVSGETYWTCVEAFAQAKLAELRGQLVYDGWHGGSSVLQYQGVKEVQGHHAYEGKPEVV